MNARQLTVVAVLAAISVAATAVVLRSGASTIASDRRGEPVLPGLASKANEITELVVRDGADPLTIDRHDGAFVAADSGFAIKTDAVRDLIASSIALAFEEARTSDPARYGELGLADPGAPDAGKEVIVRAAGGDVADFLVGSRDATVGGPVGGIFVRLKGEPQTWLARGDVRLPMRRADWFAGLDLDIKDAAIKKIELTGGGRDAVTVIANPDKPGELKLENIPDKRVPESFKVSRLGTLITSFAFDDVRKRSKPPDDPRRMVVTVDDGLQLVITGVGDISAGWVQLSAEATNDAQREKAQAISAKVDGFDFRLPANQAELLGWTATDLTSEQKS
jgi:hypothetical protein